MAEKIDMRELFLNNFVYELIKNTKPNPAFLIKEDMQIHSSSHAQQFSAAQPMPQIQNMQTLMKPLLMSRVIKPIGPMFSREQMPSAPQPKTQMQSSQIEALPSLNKISPIIKDPTVTEIECIGDGENLLVKKAGIIQKTKISLTSAEIKNILNEFSSKTSIPIIEGTFKAAFDNLIVTAVISEILGPRFIIQKRKPFQPLIT